MNVEVACSSRELFGSDRSAVRLAVLLRELGAQVRLALPASRPELGLTKLAESHGIPCIPAPIVVVSSSGVDGAGSFAMRRQADWPDLCILNSSAVALRRGSKRPRLVVLREWLDPSSRRHRALVRLHSRRSDALVCVSRPVMAQWRACGGANLRTQVAWNWLDDAWLRPPTASRREGILFVGRMSRWKGQDVLARAYQLAFEGRSRRPSLTFVGAEDGSRRFKSEADKLRARADGVWRVLPVTGNPRPHFEAAALVVIPSLRPEPFGNVGLEALAAGCRVIAFPGGGMDDLAPLFPKSLTLVRRGAEPLAEALAGWWDAGGRPQSTSEFAAAAETLNEQFSSRAAVERWRQVLTPFGM